MSDALKAIALEASVRLGEIQKANGFHTDAGLKVHRGKVNYSSDELPFVSVLFGPRTSEEQSTDGSRAKAVATLEIAAHVSIANAEPADVALDIMSDIQKAMETDSETFDGLLMHPGLEWAGDEITYPEETGEVVAVSVVYSIPHLRYFGDPTKPEVK